MLITLLIACFTTALARLAELKFRSCYQSVMKACYCALIWQRIGTAIANNSVYCRLQVSARQFLQIPVHLSAVLLLPRDQQLGWSCRNVEYCLPGTHSSHVSLQRKHVSHQTWLSRWTKTTGRVSLCATHGKQHMCFCPGSKRGGRVWAGVPGSPGDGEPPEAGDEARATRAAARIRSAMVAGKPPRLLLTGERFTPPVSPIAHPWASWAATVLWQTWEACLCIVLAGDNLQTAVMVARNVGMIHKRGKVILINANEPEGSTPASIAWRSAEAAKQTQLLLM